MLLARVAKLLRAVNLYGLRLSSFHVACSAENSSAMSTMPIKFGSTTKLAMGVLVDTSASVSAADLERASKIAADIDSNRGRNAMRVIPFARSSRVADLTEDQKPWKLRLTSGGEGRATDIEAAVREAISSLPAGMLPRADADITSMLPLANELVTGANPS